MRWVPYIRYYARYNSAIVIFYHNVIEPLAYVI